MPPTHSLAPGEAVAGNCDFHMGMTRVDHPVIEPAGGSVCQSASQSIASQSSQAGSQSVHISVFNIKFWMRLCGRVFIRMATRLIGFAGLWIVPFTTLRAFNVTGIAGWSFTATSMLSNSHSVRDVALAARSGRQNP